MSALLPRSAAEPADLHRSIRALYAAFAPYPYRATMPACAHCVSDADLAMLGSRPLAELPAALLGRFTLKAVSTWGEVHDFKWLLPRLAELLVAGELPVPAATLTAKLTRARWLEWPAAERVAVRTFLLQWWRSHLRSTAAGVAVGSALPAVAAAEADLTPYLAAWLDEVAADHDDRVEALTHLLQLVDADRFDPDDPDGLDWLFWEPAGPAAAQLAEWLGGPALAAVLDHAIYDLASTSVARPLAVAAARLRRFRSALP